RAHPAAALRSRRTSHVRKCDVRVPPRVALLQQPCREVLVPPPRSRVGLHRGLVPPPRSRVGRRPLKAGRAAQKGAALRRVTRATVRKAASRRKSSARRAISRCTPAPAG